MLSQLTFLKYMEKSSEKVIPTQKMAPNPFNNLMSEVQIRLAQPKSTKKIENIALQIDSNIDRSNSNVSYVPTPQQAKNDNHSGMNSKHTHHHVYVINAPLKTKNSSDTLKNDKAEKDIIGQWIVGFMSKRHLLGIHWEDSLKEKRNEIMQDAFNKIRTYTIEEQKDSKYRNILMFIQLYRFLQVKRKKQCFIVLKEFYRDDLLFGLSNTIKQEKNNSLMLKIDSDYESLSVESRKFNKEIKNSQEGSVSSQSYKNLNQRGSESGSASEDLSALILNHNKLKISQQLNKSTPNIPRDKNSQKSIKTSKQIGDLSLQTKKKINSQRKLSDQQHHNELPLQSNKHLAYTKKQLPHQADPINEESKISNQKEPITMTFVMKNLHLTTLLRQQREKAEQQKEKKEESNIKNPTQEKKNEIDQNIINRLPFAQSFYQNINSKNAPPVTFMKQQPQKRSTSLQIRPMLPLINERPELNINNISNKRLISNEYYPQENNRQNMRFVKENIIFATERARPKSATPKITFTFTTSAPSFKRIENPVTPFHQQPQQQRIPVVTQRFHNPQYQHQDCILESILSPHPQYQSNPFAQHSNPMLVRPIADLQRGKQNKIQVISPSQRPQSPKRAKNIPSKVGIDHKQHIKNLILPPAFNDYYGKQKSQKTNHSKFTLKDNEVIFNDHLQKSTSTAQNSIFGCSPRQSNLNCMKKEERMKSPKDKIFVTYPKGNY